MINPNILKSVVAVLNVIRPLFFAIIGGLVAGGVQNCSDRQPVSLIVTNEQYEDQIRTLQKQQDSLAHTLPDVRAAMHYIADRYGTGVDSSKNRAGSASLRSRNPRARPDKAIQQPVNPAAQR